jgi:hypothetical protein
MNVDKKYRLDELSDDAQAAAFDTWMEYIQQDGWGVFQFYSEQNRELYNEEGMVLAEQYDENGEPA